MPQNSRFYRVLRALNPRYSLRAQVALIFGLLTIVLTILTSLLVEHMAQADLEAASGDALGALAYNMADALKRDVFTRYQDLELLSLTVPLSDPDTPLDAKQRILERFQEIYPHYAWVGLADLSGQVVTSVGSRPGDDKTVATLPWFVEAQRRPYVGDLYTAVAGGDIAHYVTIAIPLSDANGRQTGILGTYLDEGWVGEIESSLLKPPQTQAGIDIMVLADNGRFLFGHPSLPEDPFYTDVVAAARRGETGYKVNTGPDGFTYFIGYTDIFDDPRLSGPGWLVLARQEAGMALAPVQQLQQRVLLIGGSLSILFLLIGWVVAGRIIRPLTMMAQAATRLRQGEKDAAIPVFTDKDEVGILSRSLHDLVTNLAQRTTELAATEQELQEVNNTLETIIQSVPLAIFLLNPDGVAHAWNPAAREMFGWREDDLTAAPNPIHAMQHEPDFKEMLHRVLSGETLTNVEKQHIRHDGTPMHVNIAMAPIYDAQNQPTGAVTVLADVTSLKQAETQLRDAHRTLSILMSNLPGMAYRRRPGGRYALTFVSAGCFDLTGYTRETLLAEGAIHYADLIHSDDRAAVFAKIEQGIAAKRPYQCTYRITTASGHERWVWEQGEAVFADDGSLQTLEGFITDNTGQVMVQRELEQRVADRTRKLSILNDVLRLTNTTDDLANLLHQAVQRMLSATRSEIGYIHLPNSHNQLHLIAYEGLSPAVAAALDTIPVESATLASNWVVAHNAILIIPQIRTDARASQLAQISPHLNAYIGVPLVSGKKIVGVLSLIGQNAAHFGDEEIDILLAVGQQIGNAVETTRLRRQEGQLMVLQERNRLSRDLHDSVTQSLYSVVLFAEAGRRKLEAQQFAQATTYLARVNDTSQQALKEMRLFIHKLRPSTLQEEGLARALQQRLKAVEGRSGIDHDLIIEGNLTLPSQLEDALFHISQEALNNSLKHARASKVTVRLEANAQQVEMEIGDDGRGFDVAKTAAASDGIGLKSMRERADALNGTITLLSKVGQGTTVRVCFPLHSE